jgi:hypothetical protein
MWPGVTSVKLGNKKGTGKHWKKGTEKRHLVKKAL